MKLCTELTDLVHVYCRRPGGMATFPGHAHHDDSSGDESDDSSSSESTLDVASQYRLSDRSRQREQQSNTLVFGSRNTSGLSATNDTDTSATTVSSLRPLSRPTRRSEIRQELNTIASTPEAGGPAVSSTNYEVSLARRRTSANRINVSNNPLTVTGRLAAAAAGQQPNSSRIGMAMATSDRIETQPSRGNSGTGGDSVEPVEQDPRSMPEPSATFQAALEQLPPISAAGSSNAEGVSLTNSRPTTWLHTSLKYIRTCITYFVKLHTYMYYIHC